MFYREHALAYPQPQFTDLWQSRGHNLYHNIKKCGGKPAQDGRNATSWKLKMGSHTQENIKIFSCQCQQGPLAIGLKSEFPLLGGQPTKANEPNLPRVSLAIQRQIPSCPLVLVGIQEVPSGGRSRTQGLRHSVDVFVQHGAHSNQHPVTMFTSYTSFHIYMNKVHNIY